MTKSILNRWAQNCRFLIGAMALASFLSLGSMRQVTSCWSVVAPAPPVALPTPAWAHVLYWPFLGPAALSGAEDFRGAYGWLLSLMLFWNVFLWAAAALELKQALARASTRIRRAPQ